MTKSATWGEGEKLQSMNRDREIIVVIMLGSPTLKQFSSGGEEEGNRKKLL